MGPGAERRRPCADAFDESFIAWPPEPFEDVRDAGAVTLDQTPEPRELPSRQKVDDCDARLR